ncbi:hypothetical protein J4421_00770 [Candidatus Woesearchaeota archaeon]|nr:hypothetical protein [Candidatus Woesearchaeota archaeon]
MKFPLAVILALVFIFPFILGATLSGSVYNSNLQIEKNVLVEMGTAPSQKLLAKNGTYAFEVPLGKFTLSAQKNSLVVEEEINIVKEGAFIRDIFLIPNLDDEEQLWQQTEEELILDVETKELGKGSIREIISYVLLGVVFIFAIIRFIKVRRKYGLLSLFRKKVKAEQQKTLEQHKEDLANEPGYLEQVLELIKKNDGRITQKEIRREMLHLSEAKISLILTELEHKGKIEKVKKGRGNVLLLKLEK